MEIILEYRDEWERNDASNRWEMSCVRAAKTILPTKKEKREWVARFREEDARCSNRLPCGISGGFDRSDRKAPNVCVVNLVQVIVIFIFKGYCIKAGFQAATSVRVLFGSVLIENPTSFLDRVIFTHSFCIWPIRMLDPDPDRLHNAASWPGFRFSVRRIASPAAYIHFCASLRLSVLEIIARWDIYLFVHLLVLVDRGWRRRIQTFCILNDVALALGAGAREVWIEAAEVEAETVGYVAIQKCGKGEAAGTHKADVDFEDAV